jgi:ATP-dependent Clp protease ATP-binding subunit ClpA
MQQVFSDNLSSQAHLISEPLDPERQQIIHQIIEILTRNRINNPILIGDYGSGRSLLLRHLAKTLHETPLPQVIKGITVYRADVRNLALQHGDQFVPALKIICEQVRSESSQALLMFDEADALFETNPKAWREFLNVFLKLLNTSTCRVGLVCNESVYHQVLKRYPLFNRLSECVTLKPLSLEATQALLIARIKQRHPELQCEADVVSYLVSQAKLVVHSSVLPVSAFDLLDRCVAKCGIAVGKTPIIDQHCVEQVLFAWYGQRVGLAGREDQLKLQRLAREMGARIYGQPAVLLPLQNEFLANYFNVKNKETCLSFCFIGPKGVGKTFMAESLQHYVFSEKSPCIAFDLMCVGLDFIKQKLSEALPFQGRSVILFDQVDAADHAVLFELLSMARHDQFHNQYGQAISLRACVLVFLYHQQESEREAMAPVEPLASAKRDTLNLFEEEGLHLIDDDLPEATEVVPVQVRQTHSLPEQAAKTLSSRFVESVTWLHFNALTPEAMLAIVKHHLLDLAERVLQEVKKPLHFSDDFASRLMLYIDSFDLQAKDVLKLIDERCLFAVTDALTELGEHTKELRLSVDQNGQVACKVLSWA